MYVGVSDVVSIIMDVGEVRWLADLVRDYLL